MMRVGSNASGVPIAEMTQVRVREFDPADSLYVIHRFIGALLAPLAVRVRNKRSSPQRAARHPLTAANPPRARSRLHEDAAHCPIDDGHDVHLLSIGDGSAGRYGIGNADCTGRVDRS